MQPVLHRLAMVGRAQRFGGQHVAYVLVAVLDASPQLPQEICSKPTSCHRPCESQRELKPDGLASVLAPAGNQKAAGWGAPKYEP